MLRSSRRRPGTGSISESHSLAFGLVGLYRTPSSARPVDEADAVLYVGTRLEEFQTGLGRYLPSRARVVQIDVDPFEIERNVEPDVAIVGDAQLASARYAAAVPRVGGPGRSSSGRFREEFEGAVEVECSPTGAT